MDLSIIIASWNVKGYLKQCLQSIYHYTKGLNFEVIVVDNASHDGSADMVAKDFPQVKLIANLENKGFGAANNQGLAQAKGKYILFLNDDTEIKENIFKTLIDKFNQLDSKVAMIGCRLRNLDGTQQDSVRAFPSIWDQTIILLKLHHIFPAAIKHYMQTEFNYEHEQTVDQVMGAFMLIPRKILDQYGSFDEGFFNWFEEVDLQYRLHKAGYKILYTPEVECVHVKGPSFSQLRRPQAQRIFNASMRYYFRKNHSLAASLWLQCIQPISIVLSYATQLVR